MILNITLFLQVANFLATYAFLHHFFFKPILTRLKEKELAEKQAQRRLREQHDTVLQKERDKRAAIGEFQAKVQLTYTVPKPEVPVAELDISYRRDEDEVEGLVGKATNIIVDRVPHVD